MKNMTIKELLIWAFTEELCKVQNDGGRLVPAMLSAGAAFADIETLGTLIDRSPNAWGVVPVWREDDEPDEDAVKVGQAVQALTARGFDIPEGWQPFPEWDDKRGLIAAEVARVLEHERQRGERQTGKHAYNLIVTCAVLKRGPDWRADRPDERMVTRQGKPAWFMMKRQKDAFGRWQSFETDGYDRRAQRPKKSAYRKWALSEPLRGAILARVDWMVWQAALKLLERELDPTLVRKHLMPMRFDPAPWTPNFTSGEATQVIEKAA